MANLSSFYETRNLFISFTGYVKPWSYHEWKAAPEDQKAAILFIQYFNEITGAWNKANAFDFIPSEDGVSIVLQYLEKNVSRINENEKKFRAPYIRTVAYNCMYCICHDLKSVQDRWDNEIPNIVMSGEDEVDLFDTVVDTDSNADTVYFQESYEEEFWKAVESCGKEAEKVARYLLSGNASDLKKASSRKANRDKDLLADISVKLEDVDAIVAELREKLAKFI